MMTDTETQQVLDALKGATHYMKCIEAAFSQGRMYLDMTLMPYWMKEFEAAIAICEASLVRPVEPEAIDTLRHSLKTAYQLGQTYWQQADSDSYSQNAKSDITQNRFNTLLAETLAIFATPQAAAQPSQTVDQFPPRIMDLLTDAADRNGSEFLGPWTDGNGDPLQDDADAAIAWVNAKGAA